MSSQLSSRPQGGQGKPAADLHFRAEKDGVHNAMPRQPDHGRGSAYGRQAQHQVALQLLQTEPEGTEQQSGGRQQPGMPVSTASSSGTE